MNPDRTNLYESPYVWLNLEYVWQCTFADGMRFYFEVGRKVPNRFHRWMHKVLLGIVWERIGDEK